MAVFEAKHSSIRKKILWKVIHSKWSIFFRTLWFFIAGSIVSTIKRCSGSSKSSVFDDMDLHKFFVIVFGTIVLFLIVYSFFYVVSRIRNKSIVRNLERRVSWDLIDIGETVIRLRRDWSEEIITKQKVREIYIVDDDERMEMIKKDWDKDVNLDVIGIRTDPTTHYIVLDFLHEPIEMSLELNSFYPITGIDHDYPDDDEDYDYDDTDDDATEEADSDNCLPTPPLDES